MSIASCHSAVGVQFHHGLTQLEGFFASGDVGVVEEPVHGIDAEEAFLVSAQVISPIANVDLLGHLDASLDQLFVGLRVMYGSGKSVKQAR